MDKTSCFKLSRALVITSRLAFVRHQIWSRAKAQSIISKRTRVPLRCTLRTDFSDPRVQKLIDDGDEKLSIECVTS